MVRKLLLGLLLLPFAAEASYFCDQANDSLSGSFTSTYPGHAWTLAATIRVTDHPAAIDVFATVGNSNASVSHSHSLRTTATDNTWGMGSIETGTAASATVVAALDNTWFGLLGTVSNDADRDVYANTLATTGSNSQNRNVADVVQFIKLCEDFAGNQDAAVEIAEVAIWDGPLSNADATLYLTAQTVPTFASAPALGAPTETTLPVTFTVSHNGNVYGTACANGTAGNAAETKLGQCSGGGAAADAFTQAAVGGVADGDTFTGLTAATTYDLSFVITRVNIIPLIDSANLIGYYSLAVDNATQTNAGVDAGGDLTVSGAAFDADHPSLTPDSVVSSIADAVTAATPGGGAPVFSGLTVSAAAAGYTVAGEVDVEATVYAVGCNPGDAAPDADEIVAGQCGGGNAALLEDNEVWAAATPDSFLLAAVQVARTNVYVVARSGEEAPGGGGGGGGGENTLEFYPLELVAPRQAGTSPSVDAGTPTFPSGHRALKAYPGIPYEFQPVIIGGAYPYALELINEPAGMTLEDIAFANGNVGKKIVWTNPTADATPTLEVTDANGNFVSAAWTIDVTTTGFVFVDAVSGSDAAAGTLAAPWQTISKLKTSGAGSDIAYFRTGTYSTLGMAEESTGQAWQRVEIEGTDPHQWLAYPGETPVYDSGYDGGAELGNIIRFLGTASVPVYIEGFTIINANHMGFQHGSASGDYYTYRNITVDGPDGDIDGGNSAGIMTLASYADPSYYPAFQNITQTNGVAGLIKGYSQRKGLWENIVVEDNTIGPDLKADLIRCTFRNSYIVDNSQDIQGGLFGNMGIGSGSATRPSCEILFNLVDRRSVGASAEALDVNQNGESGEVHVYRNTFIGRVRVRNVDSADGPFNFLHNVIENTDTADTDHIDLQSVSDASRITYTDNLAGQASDAMLDANGELQGTFLTDHGPESADPRGHMLP